MSEECLLLENMSWPEMEQALKQIEFAIVPVGAMEQHGPGMAFRADSTLCWGTAKRVAQELYPKVLVAPMIPWGISTHHMAFPGTITLRAETLRSLLADIVGSLAHHGIKNFLILNGHFTNDWAIYLSLEDLQRDYGVRVVTCHSFPSDSTAKRVAGPDHGINHAGPIEISLGLFYDKSVVKKDKLEKGADRSRQLRYAHMGPDGPAIAVPRDLRVETDNGSWGDARQSNREAGEKLSDAVTRQIVEFIEDFLEKNR